MEKEIGGYLELDTYDLPLLHHQALALNCGRNCLAYLIKAKEIRKIVLPFFLCDCVEETCRKENVDVEYYHIGMDLKPSEMTLEEDQWLFVVNYYGQLDNAYLKLLKDKYKRVIVDNTEVYRRRIRSIPAESFLVWRMVGSCIRMPDRIYHWSRMFLLNEFDIFLEGMNAPHQNFMRSLQRIMTFLQVSQLKRCQS